MKINGKVLALIAVAAFTSSLAAQAPAMSSATLKEESPGLAKRAKIKLEVAAATAQAALPKGKLSEVEIEIQSGKLVYSFDFKQAGKTGHDEVNIDAMTGKQIGKIEHETPEDEAKEAKEAADEAKAKAKKP